jgi:hypothetical protein
MAEGARPVLGGCQTVMINLKSTRDRGRDQQRSSPRSGFIWVVEPSVSPRSIDHDESACTAAVFTEHRLLPEVRRVLVCVQQRCRNRKRGRLGHSDTYRTDSNRRNRIYTLRVDMSWRPFRCRVEWHDDVTGCENRRQRNNGIRSRQTCSRNIIMQTIWQRLV